MMNFVNAIIALIILALLHYLILYAQPKLKMKIVNAQKKDYNILKIKVLLNWNKRLILLIRKLKKCKYLF